MIEEGQVKLNFETPDKVSKELDTFYNPVMKLNRDISLEILKIAGKDRPLRIGLPLSGSGIRGLRFIKEASDAVNYVHFNDYADGFPKKLDTLLKLNKIPKTKVKVSNKDANIFLRENEGFDYIDLDPFGTPNPFLDSSIQRLAREGILAVTATDTSAMAGTYAKVCIRNYDALPLRNWLKHFVGIRILIRKVQLIGAQYEKALVPIYTYSKDHYFRVFFKCKKSKTTCDGIIKQHHYLLYCKKCLNYEYSKLNSGICNDCGETYSQYAGPLWSGDLWNKECVSVAEGLLKFIPDEASTEGKLVDLHEFASANSLALVSFLEFENSLKKAGFTYSRSHFGLHIIKTNSPKKHLKNIYLEK